MDTITALNNFRILKASFFIIIFRSETMQTLAKALAPTYMRMGGTSADFLTFSEENIEMRQNTPWDLPYVRGERDAYYNLQKDLNNYTMTGT